MVHQDKDTENYSDQPRHLKPMFQSNEARNFTEADIRDESNNRKKDPVSLPKCTVFIVTDFY